MMEFKVDISDCVNYMLSKEKKKAEDQTAGKTLMEVKYKSGLI